MKLATTTGDFLGYVKSVYEGIDCFDGTNFKYLDFNFSDDLVYDMLEKDDYTEEFKRLRDYAEKKGYTFVQAHAPCYGNGLKKDEKYERYIELIKRSINACAILGIPNIVVHAGLNGEISTEEFFRSNKEFYSLFFDVMEQTGVYVLTENTYMMKQTYLFYGKDIKAFLDYVGHPLLAACWDTGHANIFTNQYHNIRDIGSYLRAVHIQDNFGAKDDHISPFQGTLNMDEIMCALTDSEFKGPFTFESNNIIRPMDAWPVYRRKFTPTNGRPALLESPSKEIRIEAEKLLYSIGKYCLESYGCFEG